MRKNIIVQPLKHLKKISHGEEQKAGGHENFFSQQII